jgi:2-methylisocitrate lyase-like PEP mutase family enzyme
MPNAWDGGSAVLLKRAGFAALGSTSLGFALSLGRRDGCHAVSRSDAVAHAAMLSHVSELPVNGDLEDGFGPEPEDCALTVRASIEAGLAGLGIEDTTADSAHPIHDFDRAVERMRAAAVAARGKIVLTGRTDTFLHGRDDLDEAIRRLVAFAEVGADVLYAPGLPTIEAIVAVGRAVAPKPLNVLMGPQRGSVALTELGAAGVRRISTGGALYRWSISRVAEAAAAMKAGDFSMRDRAIPYSEIAALLPDAP